MSTRCRMILIVDVDLDDRPGVWGSAPQHYVDHMRRVTGVTITPQSCYEIPADGSDGPALPLV